MTSGSTPNPREKEMIRPQTTVALAGIGLLASATVADTLTVCASGCQYTSINAAIDAATNGDVIVLSAETYAEGDVIDTDGKGITIEGATGKGGAAATIIDGAGTHRVLQCITGEGSDTRFENLVIQNGQANTGGGMYNEGSGPTLVNCSFIGNDSNQDGAAISSSNASPTITDCTFTDNGPAREGGAILHRVGTLTLDGCVFTNNQCEFSGGALYLADEDGGSSVTDCTFIGNSSETGGAATLFGPFTVAGCTFRGNTVTSTGGALRLGQSTSFSDCLFVENSAFEGGAMLATFGSGITLTSCVFERNTAALNGGAAYNNLNSPTFQDCRFTGNTAGYGGAVRNVFASPKFRDCSFTENAAEFFGGAITTMNGRPDISGSNIWCNTPDAIDGSYDDEGDNCINTDCTSCDAADCAGDINGDGTVDGADVGGLLSSWTGNADCESASCLDADLNGDNRVDGSDIGILLSEWGSECGPVFRAPKSRRSATVESAGRSSIVRIQRP